jgi:F0F1-type ATP synthase membrane subunit b/b'
VINRENNIRENNIKEAEVLEETARDLLHDSESLMKKAGDLKVKARRLRDLAQRMKPSNKAAERTTGTKQI